VQALAFSPDDRLLAVISWGDDDAPRQFYVWDLESGEKRTVFCGTERHISFSADSSRLSLDGKIYSVETLRVLHDFKEREAIFCPASPLIVTCRSDFTTIGLWDGESGEKLGVLKGHQDPIWSIVFNPSGTRLASGSGALGLHGKDLSVRLWALPALEIEEAPPEPPRPPRKLKRLGGDENEDEGGDNPLKDLFNRFTR
jgi:WD40 repeat protein